MIPVLLVVAEKVNVDQKTNNSSIIDVLESLTLKGETAPSADEIVSLNVNLALVFRVDRSVAGEGETGTASIRLQAPDGSVLNETELAIDLTSAMGHRGVIELEKLPIKGTGRHEFRLELCSDDKSSQATLRYPFFVDFEAVQPDE
jgi:hypothetical protein